MQQGLVHAVRVGAPRESRQLEGLPRKRLADVGGSDCRGRCRPAYTLSYLIRVIEGHKSVLASPKRHAVA